VVDIDIGILSKVKKFKENFMASASDVEEKSANKQEVAHFHL
jgi:hypothetical protein